MTEKNDPSWCPIAEVRWAEIRKKIIELGKEGILIKKFKIMAHGAPGKMGIDNDRELLNETTADNLLGDLSSYFASGAEIELSSCYIGRGEKGNVLMLKLAKLLLYENGGQIIAPVDLVWPGVDWLFDGPRYLRVGPKFSTIDWQPSSKTESDDD